MQFFKIVLTKITSFLNKELYLLRNFVQSSLQVGRVSLKHMEKFKYLGVAFSSDGRQDEKSDVRSGKAIVVMRAFSPFNCHKTGAIKKGKTIGV